MRRRALPLYALCAYGFLHVPLLILAIFSFNASRFTVWQGFSLRWYQAALADRDLLESSVNSLIIAVVSTILATVIGTLAAYALWKSSSSSGTSPPRAFSPSGAWLSTSFYLSLVTPEIVTGVSLLAFFQWIFRFLNLRLGMHTVILAHVAFSVAYVVIVVMARLRTFDRTLEEAALDLGATEWSAFQRVTLPYLGPAIAAAAMLAFTVSIDDYVITSLVAGVDSQTLPMVIYALARRGVNPMLNAVSTLIVVALGAMVLLSREASIGMNRRVFLTAVAGAACSRGLPRLNVYNWSDYVAPDTISNFEREFGVRVRYGTFESNQEMLAKVLSGNSGWDVVFPSADFVEPMRVMSLLQPLQHDLLPNLTALDPSFARPPWDPPLQWSVPYMHGVTGIAYQKTLQPAPVAWADLWDERLRGKITMLDDPTEVLGACLKKLGHSLNASDPDILRQAQQEAIRQKRLLRAYLNAEVRDQLVAGDVATAQAWAVTAGQAIAAAPKRLAFAFPSEGFARFADTMAILRESRRSELAHRFLNYLLRPDVAASIVQATQTATANAAAHRLLPAALRDNPVLYPPAEVLARGEWFEPLSSAAQKLRDRLWTEIKSS